MILGVGKHLERRLRTGTLSAGILLLLIALPLPAEASIEGFIYDLCVSIGGFVLWVCASFFDLAIGWLLIGMGDQIRNGGIGIAINALWAIIRDIFNILFIFGLVYIGFKTMLSAGDTSTRRQLAMLIAAALLINFSLFISQAVVDFTNITAVQIYNLIDTEESVPGVYFGSYKGISAAFMHYAQLQTYAEPNSEALQKLVEESGWMLVVGMGFVMMIFLLITGFVLAAGAVLIVVRFVALVLFMIASPIMFLGWVIPGLSKYSKMWAENFIKYAIMGPAYMFMIYLSLRVLKEMQVNGSFVEALSDPSAASGVVIYFIVIIAFIIASLQVSKQLGVVGASQSMSILNGGQKRVRQSVQGFAGRNTIGRFSEDKLRAFDRSMAKNGIAARAMKATGFDRTVRSIYKSGTEAKFGSGSSRASNQKTDKENRAQYAKVAGTVNLEKALFKRDPDKNFLTSKDPVKREEQIKEAVRGMSKGQLEEAGLSAINRPEVLKYLSGSQFDDLMKSDEFNDTQKGELAKGRKQAIHNLLMANAEQNQKLVDVINKASIAQLEALGADELKENAAGLSASQMDEIKKSKSFLESEVQEITTARKNDLLKLVESDPEKLFTGRKDTDAAKLAPDVLQHEKAAPYLTAGIFKQILDNDTLSSDQRRELKKNLAKLQQGDLSEDQKANVQSANNYLRTPHAVTF